MPVPSNASDRRNVVVFLCDQLRPDFLSPYGCNAVPTPNIDRLAADGVVFDDAITQSTVCGPARASLMTGRYVSDHEVWTNDVPFRDGLSYLPRRMSEEGYVTGAFGKLHHYPPHDTKGFDEAVQFEEGRLEKQEPYREWIRGRHPEATDVWNRDGYEFAYDEAEYYEHWIASHAIDFLDERAEEADDRPFLAWVSFQGPHGPLDPPAAVKGTVDTDRLPEPIRKPDDEEAIPPVHRYREALGRDYDSLEETMERRTAYAETIVEIDRQIGRVLDRLEALGVADETTFVFSSDHGDLLGDFGLDAKGPYPYHGQLSVPLVVANHPDVEAGTRSDSLAGNIDIPGTCLDVAGASETIGVSRSLLELAGEDPDAEREVNFSEFCDSIKTVQTRRYRYSYYPFVGTATLFDRENDPEERHNLAGDPEYADVERELLMHLIDFGLVNKGVRVEAHDFVPEQQTGVSRKHPAFAAEFEVAYPLSSADRRRLEAAGLPADYNEFCRDLDIVSHYAPPYWEDR
jgi:arylsulfatase A-like enzyme